VRPGFEIAVIGGGLAGACAAALLVRHARIEPARVLLLAPERLPPAVLSAPPELRVAALSRSSERILRAAAAWERLDLARLTAYEHMRVWHETAEPDGPAALHFDAADVGEPNLGVIAEISALQRACQASFCAAGGTLIEAPLDALQIDAQAVSLQCGGTLHTARLAVGADGARSMVRERAGIPARVRSYGQQALVATVATAVEHRHTAWQRFLRGGPLALLPLFDGSSSLVWSLDEEEAQRWRDADVAEFESRLESAAAGVLGAMRLTAQRLCFPLHSLAARSYVAARCALIGDAAHVIHPLAGQGANLGLLDAAALCDAVAGGVAEREDPGALRVLRRYEQQRRTHNLAMDAAMSAFRFGFASVRGPSAWWLNGALARLNRSTELKRLLARAALGLVGELPSLALGSPGRG
jgi:2-octaprenylphenol hydroxylase